MNWNRVFCRGGLLVVTQQSAQGSLQRSGIAAAAEWVGGKRRQTFW